MTVELTLLHSGTIGYMAGLLKSSVAVGPPRKPRTPLDLPSVKAQCIHVDVEVEELAEGTNVEHTRCLSNSATGSWSNGWLCVRHQFQVLEHRQSKRSQAAPRPSDAEIIRDIIATDTARIKAGKKQRSARCWDLTITYLE